MVFYPGLMASRNSTKPLLSHGTEVYWRADARARVQEPLQICLVCRSKSKKCDKQLTHIVRVMGQALFICHDTTKLSRYKFFPFIGPRLSNRLSCYQKYSYLGAREKILKFTP